MSEDSTTTQQEQVKYRLTDTSIGMIRDLLQLALILNINIIDQLRSMRFDIDSETGTLTPSASYVAAYNIMIEKLEEQANAAASKVSESEAAEEAIISDSIDSSIN